MSGDFFDTNILLYLASSDTSKADRAEELLLTGGTISVQVLNEIANVTHRKLTMSWQETRQFLSPLRSLLQVIPNTVEIHETGIDLAERYKLSVYDAMIVAAALINDCDRLWSEDMQNGLFVEGRLRIVNPFLP
ncbi:VapC toxin family PIN domain ribonuclease [Labrys okinawensis]|uniref:VapC toxin family PIN domain ribonuclease n=1 Tax=Labrys okinawensis TaxID=346911 RepID=A0A2S9Q4D0_9HYPH|nr:PIN domain-containing protein [Labrys okinawensis]PRH84201.1 VapC toxin family PIN domain ribonuclease [Labrys okinawensis]